MPKRKENEKEIRERVNGNRTEIGPQITSSNLILFLICSKYLVEKKPSHLPAITIRCSLLEMSILFMENR